ncbi:MAG: metalloregulator ArsR/SmtB family transcription factor [Alphaproteobacteria bacterium]
MVNSETDRLSAVFGALADPTRRAIMARLASGEATVSELAEPFAMSLPAVSKHLGVLEQAGLLVRERDGRVRRCRMEAAPLRQAAHWLEQYRDFWEGSFASLAAYLERTANETEEDGDE